MDSLSSVYYTEIVAHKQSAAVKKAKAKRKMLAHRGTNFKSLKPKKGYKRVKIGKRYVYVKLSSKQKMAEKRVAGAIRRFHKTKRHK